MAPALDVLNRRVVTYRFVLRTLDELGRSLTAAEYVAARARTADGQLRSRIEDPPADATAPPVRMVATQVLGLAICRYVLKFLPLAEMPDDQEVARFSPTLQRYLTGPLEPPSPAEPRSPRR